MNLDSSRKLGFGEKYCALLHEQKLGTATICVAVRVQRKLDFGALRAAWETLFARQPMLRATLRRVRRVSGDADYNLLLRQPARARWGEAWAHWFMEIQVRRGGDAGFELSSGTPCAVFSPEESAAAMRSADVVL